MFKWIVLSTVLLSSLLNAEDSAVKSLQKKSQYEAVKQEREALKEKPIKMREERKKNKFYPRGLIETH